jgi:hypothetical protein
LIRDIPPAAGNNRAYRKVRKKRQKRWQES